MKLCPKCGSTTIVGPRYVRTALNRWGEVLRYACAICGYSTDEQTKDHVETSLQPTNTEGR